MESQPQNPKFSNNHENFHPCILISFGLVMQLMEPFEHIEEGHIRIIPAKFDQNPASSSNFKLF